MFTVSFMMCLDEVAEVSTDWVMTNDGFRLRSFIDD